MAIAILGTSCQDSEPDARKKDLLDPSIVQNPKTANGLSLSQLGELPQLTFTDTLHNFGNANEGEKLVHDFTFTNTGKTPLLISGASGSCGCTAVDYPRDPIAPGKGGILKAEFNTAGKPGHQTKSITVSTNTERGVQYLVIVADVTPAKE